MGTPGILSRPRRDRILIEYVITLIGILLFINAIFSKLDPAKRENSLQPSQAAIRLLKRIEGTDEFAESEREETD